MLKSSLSILLLAAVIGVGCGGDAGDDANGGGDSAAMAQEGASTQGGAAASESTPAAGSELKGCGLITEAEATEALGMPVKYRSNDGSDNCVLDATETGGLAVDFQMYDGTATYDAQAAGQGVETVAGVGDKAVFSAMGMMSQFVAVKGGRTLMMTISGGNAAEHRAKAEAMGRVILGKI